jgi:hypothetical protein
MSAPYWFALFIALLLLVSSVVVARRYYKSYIGYGWVLEYDKKSGFGRVLSRLVKGPAGKAGVYHGDLLLSLDGRPLSFASGKDMVAFWKRELASLKMGDKKKFVLRRGEETFARTLEVELILGSIPVYEPLAELTDEDRTYIKEGIAYDTRVGQWFQTRRMSDAAFNRIFG